MTANHNRAPLRLPHGTYDGNARQARSDYLRELILGLVQTSVLTGRSIASLVRSHV